MRKSLILAVVVTLAVALASAPASEAAPKPKLPKISGGFTAQNFNSESPFGALMLQSRVAVHARARDEGTEVVVPGTDWTVTTYPARGNIQLRNTAYDGPQGNTGSVHGKVSCIANYGPAGVVDGDDPNDDVVADPEGDVWEVRFQITIAQAGADAAATGLYGSIYVQDGHRVDFEDESFRSDLLTEPSCGQNALFGLEPVLHGNVTVH